ncbi:hypothetical protein DPMN_141638 [Dreissena polymorpha]|uniref:Uncharacterized protein n=1 Tax=Dreissena polymorpha TaxID=45954 RepID=A0A9D4JHV9_DREPO|nr:hypothetical protein DPMN_141638 [Dreissena polymorpha]
MEDYDTEIFRQLGLLCAAGSSSSMVRDVHSFTLSIQRLLRRPQRRTHSNMPCSKVLSKQNKHFSFDDRQKGFLWANLFQTNSLVLCTM